jgi:hypothetical protein
MGKNDVACPPVEFIYQIPCHALVREMPPPAHHTLFECPGIRPDPEHARIYDQMVGNVQVKYLDASWHMVQDYELAMKNGYWVAGLKFMKKHNNVFISFFPPWLDPLFVPVLRDNPVYQEI